MKWSKNNRACKTVWSTLVALDQMSERQMFKTAGGKKIKSLTFFAKDASGDMLSVRAKAFAHQCDKVFRFVRGAQYEDNVTTQKAINALVKVLKDGEKTVADLADVADDAYFFFREGED
ncbi:hypothetical protein [Kaarinaea lacus]